MIVLTGISEVLRKQSFLKEQNEVLNEAVDELENRRENIDAYLNALYQIPNLRDKFESFSNAQEETKKAFGKMLMNFEIADSNPEAADEVLNENINLAAVTISTVRSAVSKLKEEA